MSNQEYRKSERIMLTLPILVTGFDPTGAEFLEETYTVVVNREGAMIALKHLLAAEKTIRIFNLKNDAAGNFRVVGPTRAPTEEGTEWGVESLQEGLNIWGVDFPTRPPESELDACALLECQTCKRKFFWPVTFMEIEVLTSTGVIQNFCDTCHFPTSWAHADIRCRPHQFAPPSRLPLPPETQGEKEKRAGERLLIKLPVLVRNRNGEAETSRTENMAPGNLAVVLSLELAVGDFVTVICPYTSSGRNLERYAEVMRRAIFASSSRKLYGMRYALPPNSGNENKMINAERGMMN